MKSELANESKNIQLLLEKRKAEIQEILEDYQLVVNTFDSKVEALRKRTNRALADWLSMSQRLSTQAADYERTATLI